MVSFSGNEVLEVAKILAKPRAFTSTVSLAGREKRASQLPSWSTSTFSGFGLRLSRIIV